MSVCRYVAVAAAWAVFALGASDGHTVSAGEPHLRVHGDDPRDDSMLVQTSLSNFHTKVQWPRPSLVLQAATPHFSTRGALAPALELLVGNGTRHSATLFTNPAFAQEFLNSDALLLRLHGDEGAWLASFCASTVVLYAMLWLTSYVMPVKGLGWCPARGRTCWNDCCIITILVLSVSIFFAVVAEVKTANKQTVVMNEDPSTLERIHMNNPGSRGFEAAMSLAGSTAFVSFCLLSWRYYGSVRITNSLLWQYALRGTTLGIFYALVLEIAITVVMLPVFPGSTAEGFNIATLFVMLVVGFSEELAKAFIVCSNTDLLVGCEDQDPEARTPRISPRHETCCGSFCSYMSLLVESPKALILAGFAVGGGFMTGENVMYLVAIAVEVPVVPPGLELGEDISERELRTIAAVSGILALVIRILFNIHPWLSGVSSGRIARIVFQTPAKLARRSAADITYREFFWCIWPSAVVHAAYDFILVTGMFGLFTLLVPLIFWLTSRWMFRKEWELCDFRKEELDIGKFGSVGGSVNAEQFAQS